MRRGCEWCDVLRGESLSRPVVPCSNVKLALLYTIEDDTGRIKFDFPNLRRLRLTVELSCDLNATRIIGIHAPIKYGQSEGRYRPRLYGSLRWIRWPQKPNDDSFGLLFKQRSGV